MHSHSRSSFFLRIYTFNYGNCMLMTGSVAFHRFDEGGESLGDRQTLAIVAMTESLHPSLAYGAFGKRRVCENLA